MLRALVRASVRGRAIVLLAAAALCVLGVVCAERTRIDVLPEIERPTVTVMAESPGLAPEEVELRVTTPLERAIAGAPGLERVRSHSAAGLAVVQAEFGWNADPERSRRAVRERVASVRGLPAGIQARVAPAASIMGEVVLIGVSSETLGLMGVRDAAEWRIAPVLMGVPGVAQVTVHGGAVRQFQVRTDHERLRQYELTLGDVRRALEGLDQSAAGGVVVDGANALGVRASGRVHTAEELGAVLVATRTTERGGVPVRVRDVASVVAGPAGPAWTRGEASVMGRPGVILAVSKQPGADTRAVTVDIDAALARVGAALPPGMSVNADVFRQSSFIDRAVGNVVESVEVGAVLVAIVLAVFLVSVRATLIALVALPISVLCTFLVFWLLGESVNTMTLGGIAIAAGELVDDAVVGVENMHRRLRQRGISGMDAAGVIYGAIAEVRGPILVSTVLVLLALAPLFFLPGVAGRMFAPLAGAYVVAIFVSMLVSLTVTPVLGWYLLGPALGRAHAEGLVLRACKRMAMWAYSVSMGRAGVVIVLFAVLAAVAAWRATELEREFLPPFNEGALVVALTGPPGMSLEDSSRVARAAEEIVLGLPEVRRVASRTGRAEDDEHALGANVSELEVALCRPGEVEFAAAGPRIGAARPQADVVREIRARLGEIPGVAVSIGQPIGHRVEHMESGVRAAIAVKITGWDVDRLEQLAERAGGIMQRVPGAVDVAVERTARVGQVRARIDAERAAMYGFSPSDVAKAIGAATGGEGLGKIVQGAGTYDVVLLLDQGASTPIDALRDLTIASPSGAVALVSDVADVRWEAGPVQIARENGMRRAVVSCNVRGRDLGRVAKDVERVLGAELRAPEGYVVSVEGQFAARQRAVRAITWLGGSSLIVMLGVLWWWFGSVALAGQVLLNIPLAFVGGVVALSVAHEPLSVASAIGFVGLAGIAARNGVLMIDHYVTLLAAEGGPATRDLVVRGSQERVAPVLMTALTTGLAMVPILLARGAPGREILYPLALVMVGGLVSSTLLDFFVTPAVFLRFGAAGASAAVQRRRRLDTGDRVEG